MEICQKVANNSRLRTDAGKSYYSVENQQFARGSNSAALLDAPKLRVLFEFLGEININFRKFVKKKCVTDLHQKN